MTYSGTWKTVLILSHSTDANRCFSLTHEPSSWADSFESFWSRVRSLSSACVKGTGWSSSSGLYASFPATPVISLCLESDLYSMLPSCSGTGRSGLWEIGLVAEGVSGYWTWYLFLRFIPFKQFIMRSSPSLLTIRMTNEILFLQSLKFSTVVLQQTWGANSLSWSPSLTPK